MTPVCTGMVACMERWKSVDEAGTARRCDVGTDDVRDDGVENSLSGGGGVGCDVYVGLCVAYVGLCVAEDDSVARSIHQNEVM